MTDINSGSRPDPADEEQLRQAMELLYFAYRDFIKEPDRILEEFGFGRAHHRAIHFVGRNPGITVSELLGILRITKQSLSRVLGQLVREGFVHQAPGPSDRRQRLLRLTSKGDALEWRLSESQRARIAAAYRHAGSGAVEGFRAILLRMINPDDREAFLARIGALSPDQTESEPSR